MLKQLFRAEICSIVKINNKTKCTKSAHESILILEAFKMIKIMNCFCSKSMYLRDIS